MKIILATSLYPPEIGGQATYVKELTERLRSAHQITVAAYTLTPTNILGTTLVTASKRQPLPMRLIKFFLVLYQASRNADVIYVQNAAAVGLPAIMVGYLRQIPIVVRFSGDEAWERATQLRYTHKQLEDFLTKPEGSLYIRFIMWLQGFVLRRAQAVMIPSTYLAEVITRVYRVSRVRVFTNYNAAEKTETIPFVGHTVPHQIAMTTRLVSWKGVDGTIRAVAFLKKEFPDVRLMVAGDGPEEASLKQLARELGVEREVTFLGRVSRAETWYLRKTSEVYVLNSTYEGLPHTVLMSFAAGIPVIATNIPGTNEAIYHEKTGLLVPTNDPIALAAAIARLFKYPSLAERIVEGERLILKEKFSWEAHITTLTKLLESVCSHPRY